MARLSAGASPTDAAFNRYTPGASMVRALKLAVPSEVIALGSTVAPALLKSVRVTVRPPHGASPASAVQSPTATVPRAPPATMVVGGSAVNCSCEAGTTATVVFGTVSKSSERTPTLTPASPMPRYTTEADRPALMSRAGPGPVQSGAAQNPSVP